MMPSFNVLLRYAQGKNIQGVHVAMKVQDLKTTLIDWLTESISKEPTRPDMEMYCMLKGIPFSKNLTDKEMEELIIDRRVCRVPNNQYVSSDINVYNDNLSMSMLTGMWFLMGRHKDDCFLMDERPHPMQICFHNDREGFDGEFETNMTGDRLKAAIGKCSAAGKRYVLALLMMSDKARSGHANAIIFDIKSKLAYQFEPHGDSVYREPDIGVNTSVTRKMKALLADAGFGYVAPVDMCPRNGFQHLQLAKEKKIKHSSLIGTCVLWSVWAMDALMGAKYIGPDPTKFKKMLTRRLDRLTNMEGGTGTPYSNLILSFSEKIEHKMMQLAFSVFDGLSEELISSVGTPDFPIVHRDRAQSRRFVVAIEMRPPALWFHDDKGAFVHVERNENSVWFGEPVKNVEKHTKLKSLTGLLHKRMIADMMGSIYTETVVKPVRVLDVEPSDYEDGSPFEFRTYDKRDDILEVWGGSGDPPPSFAFTTYRRRGGMDDDILEVWEGSGPSPSSVAARRRAGRRGGTGKRRKPNP